MRIVLAGLALALAFAPPAAAQEPTPTPTPAPVITPAPTVTPAPTPTPPPEPTVQPGVSAGGVDLSGQTESQAIATLRTLRPALRRPVELRSSGVRMKLPTRRVEQNFDPAETARRAIAAEAGTTVKLAIEFIRAPIRTFVDRFAERVLVVPRDAGVRITLTRIYRTKARAGRRLAVKRINALIERALADPVKKRTIRPKLVRTKPAVGAKDVKDRYPSIITIDRSSFTLRLFRRLKFSKSYPVAVGQAGYPTPTGLFSVQSKQVNPTWTAPNSPWAGESAGQSYDSSDPNNPLKARWIGITGSVGIHGTAQDYSIGTAASHGCIRMHVSDVIELYDRVAIGTPVLIS